jgi:hypothetical protein
VSSLAETIGDVDEASLVPALRQRVQRLRWLVRWLDDQGECGASLKTIQDVMGAKFGLRAKTVSEYVELLASQKVIVYKYGVWITLGNSLP